jgi:hypothetical protein
LEEVNAGNSMKSESLQSMIEQRNEGNNGSLLGRINEESMRDSVLDLSIQKEQVRFLKAHGIKLNK